MIERINLVPRKPLVAKLRSRIPMFAGLLLLIIALAVFAQNRFLNHKIEVSVNELMTLQKKAETSSQTQAEIIKKKIIADQLTDQYNEAAGKVSRLENIRQQKKSFSALLTRISEALPASVICKKVVFSKGNGEIVGVARGYDDLPEFVEELKRSGMFKNIDLKAIIRENNENEMLFEFNIIGEIQEEQT